MEFLSPSITFAVYAVVCLFGWFAILMIYPETAGLELEGIGELLRDGWGVKKSLQGFRERKRQGSGDEQGGGRLRSVGGLFRRRPRQH